MQYVSESSLQKKLKTNNKSIVFAMCTYILLLFIPTFQIYL